ncbi:DUF2933 domain-containing protein [Aeribacillus pallidus]|uniref:DUF2933 domain-containing protein n=1 Tax=Aeribacillus pallidus TaxID=33936 RepID=UPI0007B0933D|nr:DUF2933 domain-containing protein [Aeribacillus pallidus]
MEWLIYLLCPLMMLFCMKGMFTRGKKDCHTTQSTNQLNELKSLKMQVKNLQEQNMKLMEEIELLKQTDDSNVIILSKTKNTNKIAIM